MAFASGKGNLKYRHGHTEGGKSSSAYYRWAAMVQRCTNPANARYADYGGRGITLCERWIDFSNFIADMGEPPTGAVLDRKDNDKGYDKQNCRWTTPSVSNINRRMARTLTFNSKTQTICEWAKELGLKYATLQSRVARGFPTEKVFTSQLFHY